MVGFVLLVAGAVAVAAAVAIVAPVVVAVAVVVDAEAVVVVEVVGAEEDAEDDKRYCRHYMLDTMFIASIQFSQAFNQSQRAHVFVQLC